MVSLNTHEAAEAAATAEFILSGPEFPPLFTQRQDSLIESTLDGMQSIFMASSQNMKQNQQNQHNEYNQNSFDSAVAPAALTHILAASSHTSRRPDTSTGLNAEPITGEGGEGSATDCPRTRSRVVLGNNDRHAVAMALLAAISEQLSTGTRGFNGRQSYRIAPAAVIADTAGASVASWLRRLASRTTHSTHDSDLDSTTTYPAHDADAAEPPLLQVSGFSAHQEQQREEAALLRAIDTIMTHDSVLSPFDSSIQCENRSKSVSESVSVGENVRESVGMSGSVGEGKGESTTAWAQIDLRIHNTRWRHFEYPDIAVEGFALDEYNNRVIQLVTSLPSMKGPDPTLNYLHLPEREEGGVADKKESEQCKDERVPGDNDLLHDSVPGPVRQNRILCITYTIDSRHDQVR